MRNFTKQRLLWRVGLRLSLLGALLVGGRVWLHKEPPLPPPASAPKPVKEDLQAELREAVKNDLAADTAQVRETSFATLKRLHERGTTAINDNTAQFAASLHDAEQQERSASDLPDCGDSVSELLEAQEHLTAFLRNHGMSVRAYAGVAKCRLRVGDYARAVHAYRIAHLWQPHNAALTKALAQAKDILQVHDRIALSLAGGQHILYVLSYPADGSKRRWAILYGARGKGNTYEVHCALYREDAHTMTPLFQEQIWCYSDTEEANHAIATLYVLRMTGRRLPEIVVTCGGGYSYPDGYIIAVYAVQGNRPRCLLKQGLNNAFETKDLRHDGTYVIQKGWSTGRMECHIWVIVRPDIYAFNGEKYVIADAEFPAAFREYIAEAEGQMREHPTDYELLYNLADLYAVTGKHRKSEHYYRLAETYCRKELAAETDKDYRASIAETLQRIRSHTPNHGE